MSATRFLETVPLKLTPLTPIHIGCGVDFEPTNYVIDDGILFHFDPSRVVLEARERKELIDSVNAGSAALLRVQRFFHERRERFAAVASQAIPVAAGVAVQHAGRIGQVAQREPDGRQVNNLLQIERTAHHPHSGVAFLPGSSLKGSFRTAWLDQINGGRPLESNERANQLEKRLMDGAFHTDPFRSVMLSDGTGDGVVSKVLFSTNQKKRQVINRAGEEVAGRGPATRRECILGGQLAALSCELRLALLPGQHPRASVPSSTLRWRDLAIASNRYFVPRLRSELGLLDERGFCDPRWSDGVRALIQRLGADLETGQCVLLKVGRHSGAENVTLDGVRQIRIMQAPRTPPRIAESATTIWMAAEHENVSRGGLLPFGWLLIERGDSQPSEALQSWCAAQPKPDLAAVQARLTAARAAAAQAARQAAEQRARQEQEAIAIAQVQAREAQLQAARSPNQREIHALALALREKAVSLKGGKDRPNTELHSRARRLAQRALDEAWPANERSVLAHMLETELPKVVNLDMRDERKKLKIAALKDLAG
ncbi:MAG: RAMP superfamily CRISPR-associated protein [Betaproteobacteria bacterium]